MLDVARLTAETLRYLPRKRVSRMMGQLADLRAPSPLLDAAIQAFVRACDVDLAEAVVPECGFRSFNEFFTRALLPGSRPLDSDPATLLSPADGRVEDLGAIDETALLRVKGRNYEVSELLGDPEAAIRFRGGRFAIVYLSPRDYHRVHAPVTGPVTLLRHVPGTLYPVNSIGLKHIDSLFARNERVVVHQRSELFGEVATVMVGAIGVGRISLSFDDLRTNEGLSPASYVRRWANAEGPTLARGDELGTFHLGSTAIVFVPESAGLDLIPVAGSVVRWGTALGRAAAEAG